MLVKPSISKRDFERLKEFLRKVDFSKLRKCTPREGREFLQEFLQMKLK